LYRLKPHPARSDTRAVRFARQEPPDPARSRLRSLHPSLNTPVVVVEELPPGPASAAIACLGGSQGPQVALAIRSERSGHVVFYGPDDELREWQGPDLVLDAALSFAESMGFLFEQDRLLEAPAEAGRLWAALLEGAGRARGGPLAELERAPRRPQPAPREPEAARAHPEELWLEELAEPVPSVPPAATLTKFRGRAGCSPPRPSATRQGAADRPHPRHLARKGR
jgi:hypothetical protein